MIEKKPPCSNLIIPFAKMPSLTSFASIAAVRRAVHIKKIGHTGTLDKFADGLLVLLSGKLTRLAPVITDGAKTYDVWISFGLQTDTLDPEGAVTARKNLPSYRALQEAIPLFTGKIKQVPPEFSAIKVGGKRASDRIRGGEIVTLKARPIEITKLHLTAVVFEDGTQLSEGELPKNKRCGAQAFGDADCTGFRRVAMARFTVTCSKGTYIRALARDLGAAAGSCASAAALRRTAVGNFRLEEAVGFAELKPFDIPPVFGVCTAEPVFYTEEAVRSKALSLSPYLAKRCGLNQIQLKEAYERQFKNGQKMAADWFTGDGGAKISASTKSGTVRTAVFCRGECLGIILCRQNTFTYETVF